MSTTLSYAIKYVADMDKAVAFHQTRLGLTLRFQSLGWSEFETGTTTLALHPATPEHPAGSCQLGFGVANVEFTSPPMPMHGQKIARFRDVDGAECSVGGG